MSEAISGVSPPFLTVIASEAKQSILPHKGRMDCFVASLPCTNASRLLQAMAEKQQSTPFPELREIVARNA
jgi:hypothetical protein